MKKPKYIVEHDPISWTGYGSYIVKVNNEARTPYAVVLVPIGIKPELANKKAREKAEHIVAALDLYETVVKK